MTLTADSTVTAEWGSLDELIPFLIQRPAAASTNIYGGAIGGVDASGNAVTGDQTTLVTVLGRVERQALNGSGAAGALNVLMRRGSYTVNNGTGADTITAANIGQPAYVIDAITMGLTDQGGRVFGGTIIDFDTATSRPVVAFGMTLSQVLASVNPSTSFRARAVVTTLQAYTGTGTNTLTQTTAAAGLSAADGVTLVAGDVVFIQEGTTNLTAAKDAGPWQVVNIGSATVKWVLQRPTWWETGVTIVQGATVDISGEGTLWGGTVWKSFVAKGKVIGTDAPLFWVGRVTQQIALSSGTFQITNVGIRSLTQTTAVLTRAASGGTTTTTIQYALTVAAGTTGLVQGAINTGSATIGAMVAAGNAFNTGDTSSLNVTIINW